MDESHGPKSVRWISNRKQISCDGTGSMQEYDIFRFTVNVFYFESQRIIYNHMVDEYQYMPQQVLPPQLLHND